MWIAVALALIEFLTVAFRGLGFLAWVGAAAVILIGGRVEGVASSNDFMIVASLLIIVAAAFGLPAGRCHLIGRFVMPVFAKVLPRLGENKPIALETGTVGW